MSPRLTSLAARALELRAALAGIAACLAFGPPAVAQTPIPPPTRAFVASAAQSDRYEIAAAQDALAQSRDPRVRAFAQTMIADHRRLDGALRQAASASGAPPPPPGMSGDQAKLLSALQGLRGADFDRGYARQQVIAHEGALAVMESYAQAGADPTIRRAAQAAVPVIRGHLIMAQQLKQQLGA